MAMESWPSILIYLLLLVAKIFFSVCFEACEISISAVFVKTLNWLLLLYDRLVNQKMQMYIYIYIYIYIAEIFVPDSIFFEIKAVCS